MSYSIDLLKLPRSCLVKSKVKNPAPKSLLHPKEIRLIHCIRIILSCFMPVDDSPSTSNQLCQPAAGTWHSFILILTVISSIHLNIQNLQLMHLCVCTIKYESLQSRQIFYPWLILLESPLNRTVYVTDFWRLFSGPRLIVNTILTAWSCQSVRECRIQHTCSLARGMCSMHSRTNQARIQFGNGLRSQFHLISAINPDRRPTLNDYSL